jgi:putative hydrolase of the HAD superfamily
VEAVFFDAAGTLLRLAEPVGVTYARFAGEAGWPIDPGLAESAFRAGWREAGAPPYRPGADPDEVERGWWRRRVLEVLEACGAAVEPGAARFGEMFSRLFEHYATAAAWEVYPEVPRVLGELRSRGLRLVVVSNFDRRLHRVLDAVGVSGLFDGVVLSGDCGAWKPDPAIFARALEVAGAAPAACLHVGDDPVADVQGAMRAGLQALLLQRPEQDLGAVLDAVAGTGKNPVATGPDMA